MSMIGTFRRISAAQLHRLQDDPSQLSRFLYPDDAETASDHDLDVDKAWHAIHFLLTGQVWEGQPPLANAVLGGDPISDEDVGYGPARYLLPEDVQQVANALFDVSQQALLARFEPQALNKAGIYPPGWRGNPEELEYIGRYYDLLRDYFRAAAQASDVMLMWIS